MVTTTPNKIIEFPENAVSPSNLETLRDKGREVLDATVAAAQQRPLLAAAIGAGVVATVAATAYGATRLAHRNDTLDTDGEGAADELAIDPDALPQAVNPV